MGLTSDIRKCVLFLGHGPEQNFVSCGTAFMLSHKGAVYLVTARHVALSLGDDPFSIRMNRVDGGSDTFAFDPLHPEIPPCLKWHVPRDELVDLAIMPFNWNFGAMGLDVFALEGAEWLLDEAHLAEQMIGLGDICHAIGLFRLVQGSRRNVPIVHTGRLALVAGEERIPIEDWRNPGKTISVNGHLVELTNLEGLSGAPVIVRGEMTIHGLLHGKGVIAKEQNLLLLGVWQGSWNHAIVDRRRPLAMGVVTPAYELLKLLEQDDVVAQREEFYAELIRGGAAMPSSG